MRLKDLLDRTLLGQDVMRLRWTRVGLLLAAVLLTIVAVVSWLSAGEPPSRTTEDRPRGGAEGEQSGGEDAIAAERGLPGTREWRITRPASAGELEGYADRVSVLPGEEVSLLVSTTSTSFRVVAYRLGWYDGGTGREVWASDEIDGEEQQEPTVSPRTHTVVAPWEPSLSVSTDGWAPGLYLFKLTSAEGTEFHIPLVVRSESTSGRVALVAPVATWQAYNDWGGYSLYTGPDPGGPRSWAVSFDRPYQSPGAGRVLFSSVPTVLRAERLGVPLAYLTNVDLQSDPAALDGASGYVDLGHDEYWTLPMRRAVTDARDAGTNLAFLSANTMYWRIRLADSPLGPDRLVIGYKHDATSADPARNRRPAATTARWRDSPHPNPENSLTGTLYECYPVDAPYVIASADWWGFRHTGVRKGDAIPHLVGVEADRVYPISTTPRPLQILSHSPYDCGGVPTSAQSVYYTTPSGAGVFTAGTEDWSCAMNPRCGQSKYPDSARDLTQQVTDNLIRKYAKGPVGERWPAQDNVDQFDLPATNTVPAS
jgi:hypothetical protein